MHAVSGATLVILVEVIDLLITAIVLGTLLSILISFGVVNARNQVVSFIWRSYTALTDPILRRIRRYVRPMNGIDFSPMILILALTFVREILIRL